MKGTQYLLLTICSVFSFSFRFFRRKMWKVRNQFNFYCLLFFLINKMKGLFSFATELHKCLEPEKFMNVRRHDKTIVVSLSFFNFPPQTKAPFVTLTPTYIF